MNLFRSEEHARNWSGFNPQAEAGLMPLEKLMTMFSADFFRWRGRPDYISTFRDAYPQFIATVNEMTGGDPFWQREV